MTGWCSKVGGGKAHFVLADGKTACADRMGPHGIPMAQLFKCAWRLLDPDDHLCAYCRDVKPRECRCLRCGVVPAPRRTP